MGHTQLADFGINGAAAPTPAPQETEPSAASPMDGESRGRLVVIGAGILLLTLIAAVAGMRLVGGGDDGGAAPADVNRAAVDAAAAGPAAASDLPVGIVEAPPPSARPTAAGQSAPEAGVLPRDWRGAVLPVSLRAGPDTFTDTTSSGFRRTRLGAALAAAHLSGHVSYYTGPAVYRGTVRQQVVGDGKTELLAAMDEAYAAAAAEAGVFDEQPIEIPAGRFEEWGIVGQLGDDTVVHLVITDPQGQELVYSVPLRWQDGDWRLAYDASQGRLFSTTTRQPDMNYQRFFEQQ